MLEYPLACIFSALTEGMYPPYPGMAVFLGMLEFYIKKWVTLEWKVLYDDLYILSLVHCWKPLESIVLPRLALSLLRYQL